MTGQNLLITGQPGTGKTSLARQLVALAPRAIVFDPVNDYPPPPGRGVVATGVRPALRELAERWDEDFAIVYRYADDPVAEYGYILRMVEAVQLRCPAARCAPGKFACPHAPPIAVFLDEASLASDTWHVLPELRRLFNLGRRWRVNLVTIVQVDTDIHRVTRSNSQVVAAFRQRPSSAMQKLFPPAALLALPETRGPSMPTQGRSYLVNPPSVQLLSWWAELNKSPGYGPVTRGV